MKNTQKTVRTMVQLALMVAVTLLMAYTPIGYIKTPVLSITLLTVPVAVAGILLGPAGGAICGLTFGLTSFINALTGAGSPLLMGLLMINPFLTFVVAVVARFLVGLFTGLIFTGLRKSEKTKGISFYAAAFACPLLNTVFFMGFLMLFFYHAPAIVSAAEKFGTANPFMLIILMVGVQGLIELVCCGLIASAIGRIVYGVLRKADMLAISEKAKPEKEQ